ncbi:MAG TPA: sulfatase [Solirubrobacterales bacterium]|nr:sulfatase [Solirubrobacterales bacterium]
MTPARPRIAQTKFRSRSALVGAALLAGCAVAAVMSAAPAAGGKKDEEADRPNVVVVMSDDQTQDSLRFMPRVNAQIGAAGATFANSFVSYSLCCPSRATFLTGQYAHNHGVMSNNEEDGGYLALDSTNTLAVWLQQAGYYTGHIGKYLNGYEQVPDTIPPGWTEWHGSTRTYQYYGFQLNEDGALVDYGTTPDQYSTDVYTQKAVDFINRRAPESRPFFLWVAYLAPHSGGPNPSPQPPDNCLNTAKPAPRHATAFEDEPLPQPPSFNEADVSDKPQEVQQQPLLDDADIANIQRKYRCRLESLLAVDEGVDSIVAALRASGELDDTLFVYTSDNGFMQGEHRDPGGKVVLYEPSIRVPLLIRGPGIPKGVTVNDPSINADLAPTILALTGAEPGRTMDGLSLLPVMQSPGLERGRALLIETRTYSAVRTQRYLYAEHTTGEHELYDLENDPDELQNLQADPAFDTVEAALAGLLGRVRACSGDACRATPLLKLKLDYRDGRPGKRDCALGAVRATVKGADRGLLTEAGFAVGARQLGTDTAAPFKRRIPSAKLKRHGKSNVVATVDLLDGREMTLDAQVRRCA